ncbi:MAG: TrmB family transcriptional regulator [Candidatus Thermoplasmatota archaeon]|jgi:sugar-specific transcriptional regulator TrmB|nr:TrmB family transcriptional regulator [Candidatus Thermoplasmatota archaeon]MCL5963455.1 TrmB family transcriptional regulator [Candidatus Thermoplasmatota archaeon]
MKGLDGLASMFGSKMVREYNDVLEVLQNSGLTLYESKVYLALVVKGWGEVSVIAATADVPRTSAYKALESLVMKGFVYTEKGRPLIFKPYPVMEVAERITTRIKEVFQKLNELSKTIEEYGEPEIVYMLKGFDSVIEKIRDILSKSTSIFIISSPKYNEIRNEIEKDLDKAVARNVKIIVIHPEFHRVSKNVESHVKNNLITTDVLGDSEHALLASNDLTIGGYTNNPLLAEHLRQFLDSIIKGY